MTRQEANIKIAEELLEICKSENGKHLRFHQLLFNLGINEFETSLDLDSGSDKTFLKDKYNQESTETLKQITK